MVHKGRFPLCPAVFLYANKVFLRRGGNDELVFLRNIKIDLASYTEDALEVYPGLDGIAEHLLQGVRVPFGYGATSPMRGRESEHVSRAVEDVFAISRADNLCARALMRLHSAWRASISEALFDKAGACISRAENGVEYPLYAGGDFSSSPGDPSDIGKRRMEPAKPCPDIYQNKGIVF